MVGANRLLSFLLRPDANCFLHLEEEDLPVADFTGLGGANDRLDCGLHTVIRQNDFEFDLRQKIHCVFAAAVDFSMPFLAAEPFDLTYSHSLQPNLGQGVFDLLDFERLYNRFDFLHKCFPSRQPGLTSSSRADSWSIVILSEVTTCPLSGNRGNIRPPSPARLNLPSHRP